MYLQTALSDVFETQNSVSAHHVASLEGYVNMTCTTLPVVHSASPVVRWGCSVARGPVFGRGRAKDLKYGRSSSPDRSSVCLKPSRMQYELSLLPLDIPFLS